MAKQSKTARELKDIVAARLGVGDVLLAVNKDRIDTADCDIVNPLRIGVAADISSLRARHAQRAFWLRNEQAEYTRNGLGENRWPKDR